MVRLNINDPLIWDTWRTLYPILTNEEQQQFHNDCEQIYPHQVHHDRSNFDYLFDMYKEGVELNVIEIGGWKGELARYCLEKRSTLIKTWMNVEFCDQAARKQVIGSLKYAVWVPKKFDWFKETRTDRYEVLVSAHTIEHFSDDHMKLFVKWLSGIPTVMFEAPISIHGDNWDGYMGTHILTMGWAGVNQLMVNEGYEVSKVNEGCYLYQLKHT